MEMENTMMDIPSTLLDEIALEGLDGITISALWTRLPLRRNFWVALDDQSKNYIWKTIQEDQMIEAFLLPEPRPTLSVYNRDNYEDEEIGRINEPEVVQDDIYPVAHVEDKETGVRGSCATYKTREPMTEQFRSTSLQEAQEKWGERLVLVATQFARNLALGGELHEVVSSLPLAAYILLERIGRSRYLGETSQGRLGLTRLNMGAKNLFYFRQMLLREQLIMKQPLVMCVSNRNMAGFILHLTRFFEVRVSKSHNVIKRIVDLLKESPPHYAMPYTTLRAKLGLTIPLKRVFRAPEVHRFIKTDITMPLKDIYPEKAASKDFKSRYGDEERTTRVVQLIDPNVDMDAELLRVDGDTEDVTQNEEAEDEDDGLVGILTQTTHQHHRGLLKQAYDFIVQCGTKGTTKVSVADFLGITRLEARGVLKALAKLGMIEFIVTESARQKLFVYIAAPFASSNEIRTIYAKEKEKIIQFLACKQETAENDQSNLSETSREVPDSGVAIEGNIYQKQEALDYDHLFRKGDSRRIVSQNKADVSSELNHRALKRANLILETVRKMKVIDNIVVLRKFIASEEAKEGRTVQVDRRSLKRLLTRLANEGQIKNMRIVLQSRERERVLQFICHPSVTMENSVIKSAIEQAKLKLFCVSREQLARLRAEQGLTDAATPQLDGLQEALAPDAENSLKKSVEEIKRLQIKKKSTSKIQYNVNVGRVYGCQPKCVRIREVHRLLFYLIYGYEGQADLDQDQAKDSLLQMKPYLEAEVLEQLPRIYCTSGDWKMFIPPLRSHSGWPSGWAFYCDVLMRLPLSLFVKVVNVTYHVEGLSDYLQHPVKQHLLLPQLPQDLREHLMYERKYIFSIHEVLVNLVYFGLLQFGPHNVKEKDQLFFYLNRNTSLLDTTTSAPGYHHVSTDKEYHRKTYTFRTMEEVDHYWLDVWDICHLTPLGLYNQVVGQSVTVEIPRRKAQLVEAVRTRQPREAPELDDGSVPGDSLGAAGFDSSLFAHLKRNWSFNVGSVLGGNRICLETRAAAPTAPSGRLASLRDKATRFAIHLNSSGEAVKVPVTRGTAAETRPKRGAKRKEPEEEKEDEPLVSWLDMAPKKRRISTVPAKRTRILKARKRSRRRPNYDDIDRSALRRKRRLRAHWSSAEDNLLLLCKIAAVYLAGNDKYAPSFSAVRDALHASVPESRDKTSIACRRRITVMLRDPKTRYHVETSVEELKQDPEVVEVSGGGHVSKAEKAKLGVEKWETLVTERFQKLVPYLVNRQSLSLSSGVPPSVILPDTVDEFKSRFTVTNPQGNLRSVPREIQNTVDIHSSVVHSVIHSSLCTVEDKTSFTRQYFKVYQQYPDILLRSVIAKMKADMMIATKRAAWNRKAVGQLSLSSCPYRLSVTYACLFLTRYQHEVYAESFGYLAELLRQADGQFQTVDFTGVNEGGLAAVITALMAYNALDVKAVIPDQVLTFDPRVESKPEQFSRLVERYNNLMKDAQLEAEAAEEQPLPVEPVASSSRPGTVRVQQQLLARTASRIALHAMREELTHDKASDGLPVQHLHDFFVLNACKLTGRLRSDSLWNPLDRNVKTALLETLQLTVEKPSGDVADLYRQRRYGEDDVKDAQRIMRIISSRKEQGVFVTHLPSEVGDLKGELSLEQHMKILLAVEVVLRVGVVSARYVAAAFAAPWVVRSFKLTRLAREKLQPSPTTSVAESGTHAETESGNEGPTLGKRRRAPPAAEVPKTNVENLSENERKAVNVLMRPWVRIDGSLNRRVLDRLLGAVLGHVMQKPGCSLQDLGVRFHPALQPFHTRELAEFLEKLGCISLFSLRKSARPTLFSSTDDIEQVVCGLPFEPEANIYCKPLMDGLIRLGQFIGNKQYEMDYIPSQPFTGTLRK